MTWPTGLTWAWLIAASALVLLSSGCTTIVVENPTVEIEINVAGPTFPTYQPMELPQE